MDKRVREAISLAIDRDAINETECRGMGVFVDGN
jgi:ABC-type transport system substrate-binding protein